MVWFNFGFHSLNVNQARAEYGLRNYASAYATDLEHVVQLLTAWARRVRSPPTRLIFGLTTPMLFSVDADNLVKLHNVCPLVAEDPSARACFRQPFIPGRTLAC